VPDRPEVETDLVQAGILQFAAEIGCQHGAVGVKPEMDFVTAPFPHGSQKGEGKIWRQERFAAADADTAEAEGGHVIGILVRIGKSQAIGNRRPVIVLCRGTVKTLPVTAAVDKKAGPAAIAAVPATGRETVAIHLGPGITESGMLRQPLQQFPALSFRSYQPFTACKGQKVVAGVVLETIGFDQPLLIAFNDR